MTNIKKIVIWALLIVNLFFLTVFLWRLYADHRAKTEALSNLSTLFERNGIYMNTGNIREGGELAELTLSRDIPGEQKLAETLLGKTEQNDQGGTYTYTGTNGNQAVFRTGGEFGITFKKSVYDNVTGEKNTAKSLLQTMGLSAFSVETESGGNGEKVTAVCTWNSQPIFNCRISFLFDGGNLVQIDGRFCGTIRTTAEKIDMSSCATSLMYFLNAVKNGQYSCARITGVEPGYYIKAPGNSIIAVWRLETDTGVYYADAATGGIYQDAAQIQDVEKSPDSSED